jgi:hypothetical protein
MVILKIADKEYNLSEGWNEVNLEKFKLIMKKNQLIREYKSQILFGLEIFSILIDCHVDDLKNLTKTSFETLTGEISWINDAPVGIEKEYFIIDGVKWKPLKDLNKLTMGDNISIEMMINESDETDMLINILPILLRRVRVVKDELGNEVEELMPFDAEKYEMTKTLFMKNIFITDVINFKDFF